MLLSVITPEKVEWLGEVDSVTLPTVNGLITVLPGHISMICAVVAGELLVKQGEKQISLFVSEGSAQIKADGVDVLVEVANKAADITAAQVEEARRAAEKAKVEKTDDVEFAFLESNLKRELAKEKIMDKYKKGAH